VIALQAALAGYFYLLYHPSVQNPSRGLTVFGDIFETALLILAAASMAVNIPGAKGPGRHFWILMALGCALWAATNLGWSWVEVIEKHEVPASALGDLVLFMHLVPFLAALAVQPHQQREQRGLMALDFSLLLIWWMYLYVLIVFPWWYVQYNKEHYDTNFNLIYLVETGTLVLLWGILWQRAQGYWRRVYGNFFGASLTYMLGSQLASFAIDKNWYYTGSLYDVPLVAGTGWFALAGFLALERRQEIAEEQSEELRVVVWPARLAMAAVLSTPLAALWAIHGVSAIDPVTRFRMVLTLAAILLMSALLFFRQTLSDRRLLALLRSSNQSLVTLQKLQFQLLQSEKMASLGRLVGGAAHEINNPLTAILGYADLLADRDGETRTLAQKIRDQARRTKALVSDLLDFAQAHPTEQNKIRLDAIMASAMRMKQEEFASGHVQMQVQTAENLPVVTGDPNQILKVFLHLINNALDAVRSQESGKLLVNLSSQDGFVIVEFRDNGPGIAEPERVFDPFYTTKPVGQGTGLGLSVCYGIIRSHKGEITCQNSPEGGAAVKVTLPVA
jgi:signal transduction histidine kinase